MIALRSVTLPPGSGPADVTLELAAGEVALVTGPSGSGKTQLTRLLYGAARPAAGRVLIFNRDLARLRASSIALLRRRVAVVTQEMALIERDTALANAAVPMVAAGETRREARTRALAALARFGLDEVAQTPVTRLSSGQRRRVCLARAAVSEAAILVADDPTAHLDAGGRLAFLDLVTETGERGGAALVASSDPALAAAAIRLGWQVIDLAARREVTEPVAADNLVPFPRTARSPA